MMKLLILIILSLFSCAQNTENKIVTFKKKKESNLNQLKESHFDVFLNDFKKVVLPFNLTIGSTNWINFSDGKPSSSVIPIASVKKYFYSNSDKQLKESSFDQFYYGNVFEFSDNLIGLTYYGTSKDENGVSGYQLVLFDKKGVLQNTLLIAGTRGVFDIDLQIEAEIEKTKIVLNRIELDLAEVQNLNRFKGKQKWVIYQISDRGSVNKVKETEYKVSTLTTTEDKNYRIKVIK